MALTSDDISRMVRHWLSTPVNAYLGSGYGCDPYSLLHQPQRSGLADAFIDKMLDDIPLLRTLPGGSVNAYFEEIGKDRKRLLIEIGDIVIPSDEISL